MITVADPSVLLGSWLTLPTAAARCGLSVDRVRLVARLREAELVSAGVLVRVGRWRLARADRLTDLAAACAEPLRGV